MGDFSEYLNQKYGNGGGSNAAPVEEKQNNGDFTSYLMSKYGQNTPVTSSVVSTGTKETPVQNLAPELPKTVELPNFTEKDVVADYESIPNYNLFERLFSKEKSKAYDQKQAMYPEYQKAKYQQTEAFVKNKGISDSTLGMLIGGGVSSGMYTTAYKQLQNMGLSKDEIADVYDYAQNYYKGKAEENIADATTKAPVGMNALGLVTNPFESFGETVANGVNYVTGRPIKDNYTNITNTVRETTNENIVNNANTEWGGKVGSTLYNAGMSIGDEVTALAIQLFTGIPASAIQGLEKASGVTESALERGLTPKQIMLESAVSGVLTTYLTEKFGVGSLEKNFEKIIENGIGKATKKEIAKYIGMQMFSEGKQEMLEDVADMIADGLIALDKNELKLATDELIANGETKKDALIKVVSNKLIEVLLDGAIGGLSGGLMAGGNAGVQYGGYALNKANNELNNLNFGNLTPQTDAEIKAEQDRQIARRIAEEQRANARPDMSMLADAYQQTVAREQAQREQNIIDSERLSAMANRMAEEQNANSVPNLTELLERASKIPNAEDIPTINMGADVDENIDTDTDIPFANPEGQTSNVPTVETPVESATAEPSKKYSTTNIGKENKSTNDLINSLVNMFARSEEGKQLKAQLKSAINRYIDTKSETDLAEVRRITAELERQMRGSTYTTEKSKNNRSGKVKQYSYPTNMGTITDNIESLIREINGETISTSNVQGADVEEQNLRAAMQGASEESFKILAQMQSYLAETQEQMSEGTLNFDDPESPVNKVVDKFTELVNSVPASMVKDVSAYGDLYISQALKDNYVAGADVEIDIDFDAFEEKPAKKSEKTKVERSVNKRTGGEIVTLENPDGSAELVEEIPYLKRNPDGTYTSQTAYNSIYNGIAANDPVTDAQFEQEMNNGNFIVKTMSEDASVKEANQNLANDYEFEKRRFEKAETIDGVLVDEAMIMLDDERQKALQTGNFIEFNRLSRLLVDKMHSVGQALQALAKYTRSATGSMMQTETLRDAFTNEYFGKRKNQSVKKTLGKLATALRNMGYDGTMDVAQEELTHPQMVERVINTMEREYASIFDMFEDADFEYIARLIEGNYSTDELTQRLEQRIATGTWGLSQEEVQQVTDLFNKADEVGLNSRKAAEYLNQAYAIEAQHIGGQTFMDKWNAWRYFAMLGNTRTHIRNIFGNLLFGSVTDIKDSVVAGLESAYQKINPDYERTTSVINRVTDADLLKATKQDYENNGYGLANDNGHKYNMKSEIERHRKQMKLIEFNNKALEAEDDWALKRKYSRSLASYLKANGLSADILTSTDEGDIAIANKAREYAVKQAKEATFHEDNKLATLLNNFSRDARATGGVGGMIAETVLESAVPFKKTPANILKEGYEYSPLGLLNVIGEVKNQASADQYINTIGKSLTGSAIMVLGLVLAQKGILRAGSDNDDDKVLGEQEYSINIGNHSYTIDWMAPAALPLFVGAEVYNAIQGDNTLIDAMSSIAEPMIELSMLQGIRDTLKSISNGIQNDPKSMVANAAITFGSGYLSQGIPTIAGQFARALDDTRRSTYSDQKGVAGSLDYQMEKIVNKIPGLSKTNEAYVDVWGDEQKNPGGNFLGRLAYNMLSPGYYSNTERTPVESEIERLSETQTKETGLMPSLPNKNYKGSKIDEKTYESLSKSAGKYTTNALNTLIGTKEYKNISDVDKAATINDLESFCQALAKNDVLKEDISKNNTYKRAYAIYKSEGMNGVAKYYMAKNIKGNADANGNGSVTQEELGNYLNKLKGFTTSEKEDFFTYVFPNAKEIPTLH